MKKRFCSFVCALIVVLFSVALFSLSFEAVMHVGGPYATWSTLDTWLAWFAFFSFVAGLVTGVIGVVATFILFGEVCQ